MPTVPYSRRISIRFGLRAGYPVTPGILFMENMFISLPATIAAIPFTMSVPEVIATHALVDSSSLVGLDRPRDTSIGVNARPSAATIDVSKQ